MWIRYIQFNRKPNRNMSIHSKDRVVENYKQNAKHDRLYLFTTALCSCYVSSFERDNVMLVLVTLVTFAAPWKFEWCLWKHECHDYMCEIFCTKSNKRKTNRSLWKYITIRSSSVNINIVLLINITKTCYPKIVIRLKDMYVSREYMQLKFGNMMKLAHGREKYNLWIDNEIVMNDKVPGITMQNQ